MRAGMHWGAVVLAAGLSCRFGAENKLLHAVDGMPMARRAVEAILRAGVERVCVVLGHDAEAVASVLDGLPVTLARNDRYAEGMGTSLAKGIKVLDSEGLDGCLVSLGDLPYLEDETVGALMARFEALGGERVVAPVWKGRRGHPVAFPRRLFGALGELRGDVGAKAILRAEASVEDVAVSGPGCVRDVDTLGE